MVTAGVSSAVLYADGSTEWFGRVGSVDGFTCQDRSCVRADAGRHTICYTLSDGTALCDDEKGQQTDMSNMTASVGSTANKLLKCAVGYRDEGCCVREDNTMVCRSADAPVSVAGTDWVYVAEHYVRQDIFFIGITKSGLAYSIEVRIGDQEATVRQLLQGRPVLAGGFDRISMSTCMLSASPATYGGIICEDSDGMPPPEIATLGVASFGCIQYPSEYLDVKKVLFSPGAPCSTRDQAAVLADTGETDTRIHLAKESTFGILPITLVPLTPTSGTVRLYIDTALVWPSIERTDRLWNTSWLDSNLYELECSQGGRTYNGDARLGALMPERHIDIKATESTRR